MARHPAAPTPTAIDTNSSTMRCCCAHTTVNQSVAKAARPAPATAASTSAVRAETPGRSSMPAKAATPAAASAAKATQRPRAMACAARQMTPKAAIMLNDPQSRRGNASTTWASRRGATTKKPTDDATSSEKPTNPATTSKSSLAGAAAAPLTSAAAMPTASLRLPSSRPGP